MSAAHITAERPQSQGAFLLTVLAAIFAIVALPLPISEGGSRVGGSSLLLASLLLVVPTTGWPRIVGLRLLLNAVIATAAFGLLLALLSAVEGRAGLGYWAVLTATAFLTVQVMRDLARLTEGRPTPLRRAFSLAVPVVFGLWLLILWECLVRGFGVPPVLLPPPSAIAVTFASSLPTLWADFRQTFLKAVIAGYAMGCGAGFLLALLVDRVPFLKRGLLPVGNLVSALPIVGIAPIMVMWFGFDWPSKAAVVVVMTFFPMLVNTVSGLNAAGAMERDLMRTYAATHTQSLIKLRLPAALPFIFNALKINSTLALIGAIVAEFFGTPIVGMGFRISTEVGRMNIDMVWAEITVAAIAGSLFYGLVALIERTLTFWHPSYRH
ncbi:ABC transporter permease [Afifella marina]|uniref:NitT/TauT family transport system permease protein n=1 Tax=Afifella marina DSM 2698 TaxID=1120955 RepID=A0A1G5NZ66_AFIMA|nr:ABC transporter permease [Afifella marina]SCZ42632.1 NitT/TauT family transport system permease protein [Afifella marina DSM 2698]